MYTITVHLATGQVLTFIEDDDKLPLISHGSGEKEGRLFVAAGNKSTKQALYWGIFPAGGWSGLESRGAGEAKEIRQAGFKLLE